MDAKEYLSQLSGPQRGQLTAQLLTETLEKAKEAGITPEDAASGLLLCCITTMQKAVGPIAASRWLLDLSKGILDQVEQEARTASAEQN